MSRQYRIRRNYAEVQLMMSLPRPYFKFWRSLFLLLKLIIDCMIEVGPQETIRLILEGIEENPKNKL